MTLKASAAGLDFGGGKSVLIDDGAMPPGSELRAERRWPPRPASSTGSAAHT